MNIDRIVMAFAGTVVLASLLLGILASPYWFFLTGFVCLNLLHASSTFFCPLALVLKKLGAQPGCAF